MTEPEVFLRNGASARPLPGESHADMLNRALRQDEAEQSRAGDTDRARLGRGLSLAEARKQAQLVVRCQDCQGQVVALASLIAGRPLLWVSATEETWLMLDATLTSEIRAHCRAGSHVLVIDKIRTAMTGPKTTLRLRHPT